MAFRKSRKSTPSPLSSDRPRRFEPLILKLWAAILYCGIMICLAVGLEVAVYMSQKHEGFHVPEKNVLSFNGFFSAQFLASFFPVLLVAPMPYLWSVAWFWFRMLQPYIELARGDSKAESSVTLNYVAANKFKTLVQAWRRKQFVLLTAGILTFGAIFFQPLAGAIFEIKMRPVVNPTTVTSVRNLGLSPDIAELNSFSAAAGYAEAAVLYNLSDPSFVMGNWTIAEFKYPKDIPETAISLIVNTTGIQTLSGCAKPVEVKLDISGRSNYTIDSSVSRFAPGGGVCSANVTFNPSTSDQQYGVVPVDRCGGEDDVRFQPIMFWYFVGGEQPKAATVFCAPTLKPYKVQVSMYVANATLFNVRKNDTFTVDTDVTDGDMKGRAFNSVLFPQSNNTFVNARALSIKSAIPGAVYRFAAHSDGGIEAAFDKPEGFFTITDKVYSQHLSISAKSNYFVAENNDIHGRIWAQRPRLWINPLSAHALAGLLALTGLVGFSLFFSHWRQRRTFYLAHEPGSIASSAAFTAKSGLGTRISPFDTDSTMRQKLRSLRFRLDRSSGTLEIDEGITGEYYGRPLSTYASRSSVTLTSTTSTTKESEPRASTSSDRSSRHGRMSSSAPRTGSPLVPRDEVDEEARLLGNSGHERRASSSGDSDGASTPDPKFPNPFDAASRS